MGQLGFFDAEALAARGDLLEAIDPLVPLVSRRRQMAAPGRWVLEVPRSVAASM